MAKGVVSKDSWSRCESPSMLYGARNPSAPLKSPEAVSAIKNKDTIESTQQRLRREMLNKLDNKGLELPHETYVAVIQVGKYMFMAVMLPVYLCCYGIPRWILVNAMPHLFLGIKNQAMRVGRFFVEMTKRVMDTMKGLLDQLIGDSLRMSRDRAKNVWNYLSNKFIRLSKVFSNMFKAINPFGQRSESAKVALAKRSAKLFNEAQQMAHAWNQLIVEKARAAIKQLTEIVVDALTAFDRVVFTPFVNFLLIPFKFLARVRDAIKKVIVLRLRKAKELLKRVTDPVSNTLKKAARRVVEEVKKAFEKVMQPIATWLHEKKEIVDVYFQQLRVAVVDPLFNAARSVGRKFGFVGKKVFKVLPSSVKRSVKFSWKLVSQHFEGSMSRRKKSFSGFGKSVKGLAVGFVSGISAVGTFGFKLLRGMLGKIVDLVNFCRNLIRRLKDQLATLPRMFFRLCFAILKVVGRMTGKVVFVFQVLIALVCIAFMDGFHLVRDVSRPLQVKEKG